MILAELSGVMKSSLLIRSARAAFRNSYCVETRNDAIEVEVLERLFIFGALHELWNGVLQFVSKGGQIHWKIPYASHKLENR